MTKFSFIITARNESPEVVRTTIEGLVETARDYPYEIVLVDDGSEQPIEPHAGVVQVRNPEPLGVSRARRQGGELATGDGLVWLDAHMTFDRHWLDRMSEHFGPEVLLCSAFWSYHRTECHGFGADFVWSGTRDYHAARNPGLGFNHRVAFPGQGAVDVPMLIGACYMMHRQTYTRLGGFCPLFRVWGVDEQDLSARAWFAGVPVRCVTGARVGHMWRPSFPYPVQYDHVEFNQLVLVRSVFEERNVAAFERWFEPIPQNVRPWLDGADLAAWRAVVQSARRIDDDEFLQRFIPEAPRVR